MFILYTTCWKERMIFKKNDYSAKYKQKGKAGIYLCINLFTPVNFFIAYKVNLNRIYFAAFFLYIIS